MTEITVTASSPCTTLGEVRGGSNAARRQVIQIPAGFARTSRKRLSFPGFPAVRDIRDTVFDHLTASGPSR
jgi:hypothetical protein